MAKKFLTLDIGAANIALAEYEAGAKGALTLVNYGTAELAAPIDTGDASTILVPALMDICREKGIKPGPVAISLSGQMVFPRVAAILAAGGEDKFEQMVRLEIEQNIPFPIDEMVCDRQVLGDTASGEKSVLIVAAKVDQVESITDAVGSAGFEPTLVDVAPMAVTNVLKVVMGSEAGCSIVLDIGAKTTSLVIVDDEKLYIRSIPIAGNNITREVGQSLGCTPPEAEAVKRSKGYVSLGGVVEDEDPEADRISKICRTIFTRLQAEISRSVNFYRSQQGGAAPMKLYLTGGTVKLPQVGEFFSNALGIEVEFLNPFQVVSIGAGMDKAQLNGDLPLLASTAGVALHCAGRSAICINLLPPSIAAARAEKAKIPVLLGASASLLAALAVSFVSVQRQSETAAERQLAAEEKVEALKGFAQKVKTAEQGVATAKSEAEALRQLMLARSAQVVRLNAVRSALSGGMWIDRWEEGKVTVRGWKDRLAALVAQDASQNGGKRRTPSEIVESKLKGNAVIDPASVRISDMSSVGRKDEVEQFTVELKFK